MEQFFHTKRKLAIRKALSCKGWTNERKLSVLFDLAQKTDCLEGDILEIGSAWGRSTVLLGYATRKPIWSIDPHTGGLAYIKRGKDQNSFLEFMRNIERYGISNRVRVLKYTTQETLERKLIPNTVKFSLVFIDALHTPEGVQMDFNFSYNRLLTSGAMLFDDYFEPSVSDYAKIIDRLMHSNSINLIKDKESGLVWFLKS